MPGYRFIAQATALVFFAIAAFYSTSSHAEDGLALPAPTLDQVSSESPTETAVLAGGCFWGVQGVFQHVEGVTNAVSGYAGGDKETATYQTVSSGSTSHAEAVKITFDPKRISYGRILQIYFSAAHDPTQLNRQGPDSGTQYRSAVFPQNDEQAKITTAYIAQLTDAKIYHAPIVTKVEQGKSFYPAEAHHQDYLTLHPTQPYIFLYDLPKLRTLKRLYPEVFREKPALVSEAKLSD